MGIPRAELAQNEFCLCGCGGRLKASRTGYAKNHWFRSPEGRALLSRTHSGKTISAEQRLLISGHFKGRTFSPAVIRKLSETKRGPLNPNWRGGRSLAPYSEDWWFVRHRIRRRDSGRCLIDQSHDIRPWKHADIHHIDGNQQNNADSNLISLCRSCHSKAEKNLDGRAEELHAILSERYGYVYS
mgnify:CR=1 FL=1